MMYARNSVTALVVIATLALHSGCQAQTPCTTDGWFGPNCQYQCHCAGSAPCDKQDGSCSSGCHQGWFGPACQYDRLGYSGPGWLTDSDDTTCNTGNIQPVTVTLDTAIPLTWVRVVVRNAGDVDQIQLNYELPASSPLQACPGFRKASVDNLTLDIECSTTELVSAVYLFGSGISGLCSLYISGGRNVALKQTASQSSKFEPGTTRWNAGYAVDGTTGGNSPFTCTHTQPDTASPGWWEVTFSQAVDVTRFLIFNRVDCANCEKRLVNFTLTAQSDPSTATPYSYRDPGGPGQASYTVIPSPRISFPVSLVRFVTADSSKILTLCEVFVFGENNCPAGQFGLRCERQCNCANNESCFVHSGGCPSGCATGYTGEDCSECQPGLYGDQCDQSCSATCGGDNSCDRNTGTCSQSCDPGYLGTTCETKCTAGSYGAGCVQTCSVHCAGSPDTCNHITGHCDQGCEPGYQLGTCDQECEAGKYGAGCEQTCSVHCDGSPGNCSHITGDCDGGCEPGYQLGKCDQVCSLTTYGQNCSKTCNDTCVNKNCHHVTGQCRCPPGFQGDKCDQQCPTGKYGLNCSESCSSNCRGSDNACNHENGTCTNGCEDGYRGDRCDTECAAGRYGAGCEQTCSVNCAGSSGSCNHITGDCDGGCEPGYQLGKCDQAVGSEGGGGGDSIIPAVIGAVVAVVVITAIIVGFIIWRRRKNRSDEKQEAEEGVSSNGEARNLSQTYAAPELREDKRNSKHKRVSLKFSKTLSAKVNDGYEESSEEDTDDEKGGNGYVTMLNKSTALPVKSLKEYILQHSTDSHFKDEFSSIPMANSSSQTVGLTPGNIKKNRYKNIIPYDSSRVLLQADRNKGQSDYINASYVQGYEEGETFIASQGPNDVIINDFVRMLWEQKVDRVVMLTNLIELGKKKCSMYWPGSGEKKFGEVTVRLLTTHVFAQYTIRHLRLSQNGKPALELTQFHFTAWPDKSVPKSPWGLVDFHQRVMAVPGSGPVLVHCSAGVGRTGTFIALCNLLREAEDTGKMNFLDTLWKLRQDRMHTIQTVAQYVYLHKAALVGHTVAGSTIQVKDMNARLAALESEKPDTKSALSYSREFEAVVAVCDATINQSNESTKHADESVYQNTSGVADKMKNRLSNILPNQAFRPVLQGEAHKEDTYINAVLVPNLIQNSYDLLTQLPLPSTVTDFWRLVTQFDVGLVVAFDMDSGNSDETIGDFLPKSEKKPFENDRYLVETEPPIESTVAREFPLTVHQKAVSGMGNSVRQVKKTLTFLACKNPELDPECVLELQEKIKSIRTNETSHAIFACRNGADQCGLMCVQSILLDRLEADQCLTVPLVVGGIKAIRPQVIPTVDQYKCLYRVLKLAHESKNVYGNVGDGSL